MGGEDSVVGIHGCNGETAMRASFRQTLKLQPIFVSEKLKTGHRSIKTRKNTLQTLRHCKTLIIHILRSGIIKTGFPSS